MPVQLALCKGKGQIGNAANRCISRRLIPPIVDKTIKG